MINGGTKQDWFRLHPLLLLFARDIAKERKLLAGAEERHTAHFTAYAQAHRGLTPTHLDALETEFNALFLTAYRLIEHSPTGFFDFYLALKPFLQARNYWQEALKLLDAFFRVVQTNGDYYNMTQCLIEQGQFFQLLGQIDRAEQALRQADRLTVQVEPEERRRHIQRMVLNSLGEVYQRQGKFDEAVTAFQQLVATEAMIGSQRGLANSADQNFIQLNSNHPEMIKVREQCEEVIETLIKLSPDGNGVRQELLIQELLKNTSCFQHQQQVLSFLELLKGEEVIRRDARRELVYLNPSHWVVVALNADSYLSQFVIAFDHTMLRQGFREIFEYTLFRHLALYMEDSIAKSVYGLALAKGWINRRDSREKFRNRDEYIVLVKLDNNQAEVGKILRNGDILLKILYHKSARDGLTWKMLWEKLKNIRLFTLDEIELKQWLNIVTRDSILIVGKDQNTDENNIKLNLHIPLTQRLLGRMNVWGLIRNIRLMGATNPDKKDTIHKLRDRLTKFVTNHDSALADWTIEYAHLIKLIEVEGDSVFINSRHSFVTQLDQRESATCEGVSALVKRLVRPNSDGWVPRQVVIREMEKDIRFGYARGEHDYWLDQAIYRLRLLEEKKEQSRDLRPESYVRSTHEF